MRPASQVIYAILVISILVIPYIATAVPASAEHYEGPTPEFGNKAVQKLKEILKSDKVSSETKTCIQCHIDYTPGIVFQWLQSAHAQHPAKDAAELYKAIGAEEWIDKISPKFRNYDKVVGCYECHGMYADKDRPDVYEHFGFKIVTVVTRKDCGQCHPKENTEISWTWHATGALHAPFLPWYKGIVSYVAKKLGGNPFGDEKARKIYEEYLPPYLTKARDKEPVYWDFYKKIARAIFDYLNGKATDEDMKIISMLKEATGMISPYDYDLKTWISPNWPASGVLNSTVLERHGIIVPVNAIGAKSASIYNPMSHPWFRNAYVYHACFECHGSVVVPYKLETVEVKGLRVTRIALWGWPSNGAARVDPDGSMGTCTACHPRHMFSIKQARKPWTCGQCHLGYDHPHIEIYEESKHGNIENAYGEKWNWERLPWRVGVDFNAPTCATCHMSTLSVVDRNGNEHIVVKGTHDLVARLVWDQMHFFTHPKPVIPDKPQVAIFLGGFSVLKGKMEDVYKAMEKIPENSPYKSPVFMGFEIVSEGPKSGELAFPRLLTIKYTDELAKHREEMKKVCTLCHSSQWTDNFFRSADQNIIDYDIVARFANYLLQLAWKLGIHDKKNIIDEYMEIMWYYIWHHEGRRWRNGAFMMGPDYAHWYGIVDTVMDKLGRMISYLDTALKIRMVKTELEALKKQATGAPYMPGLAAEIAKLKEELSRLEARLEALQAQVPVIKDTLEKLSTEFRYTSKALSSDVSEVKESVAEIMSELKKLVEQLPAAPAKEKIKAMLSDIEKTIEKLSKLEENVKQLNTGLASAKSVAEEAKASASAAQKNVAELSKKVEELKGSVESMALASFTAAVIAIVIAIVAAIVTLVYRRK